MEDQLMLKLLNLETKMLLNLNTKEGIKVDTEDNSEEEALDVEEEALEVDIPEEIMDLVEDTVTVTPEETSSQEEVSVLLDLHLNKGKANKLNK